jgi:excinuclease ABC subunit C
MSDPISASGAAPIARAAADSKNRLNERLRQLPHRPGVYMMKDRFGSILYVGKAKDLKKRVASYFQRGRRTWHEQPKIAAMISLVRDVDTIEVRSETEALLLEGRLIKDWRPKYNTDFVDDKRFLLVRLDPREMFPRFRLVRLRREDGARYFGPFANGGLLRRTLAGLRRQFGVLLGDAPTPVPVAAGQPLHRLYGDARAEIYGHPNEVTPADYAVRLDAAVAFLEGNARDWLAQLKEEMAAAAAGRRYERAAELRDLLQALELTTANTTRDRRFLRGDPVKSSRGAEAARELAAALALPAPPRTLECFDISHISGEFVVAALARFTGGAPDKSGYRLFRIRGPIGNDDFRAMEQAVGRRYGRLHREGRPLPDLLVIDGGLGQVHAALKAFLALDLDPPPLIGLAKREETVVFPDERPGLRLPAHSSGLQLLQRLRDEAHRFANAFNAKLRSKKIRESLLDDFSGLGEKRKAALLARFKNLTRLRAATVEELRDVPGFGPTLAARLHAHLPMLGKAEKS